MNLSTAFGVIDLQRFPATSDRSLQPWDAADELIIAHVADSVQSLPRGSDSRMLICNDMHGALGCSLHGFNPVLWSDSSLSHTAVCQNWHNNALPGAPQCVDSISTPAGPFDVVLIKIPKIHALLEDQLARIRPLLHCQSVVVAGGMVRHLQRSVFALFEKYIGELSTSLAKKKARLMFCSPDSQVIDKNVPDRNMPDRMIPDRNVPDKKPVAGQSDNKSPVPDQVDTTRSVLQSPYPDTYTDDELGITMINHANVFCRERVDNGARLLLAQLEHLPEAGRIVDLACGNGIIGIHVQQSQPDAHLRFIDESYMAVESARENYARLCKQSAQAPTFTVGNALDACDADSIDLIVCNPPFHVQHAVVDDTARLFFTQAARCLQHKGELWLVANRRLPYRRYLKRDFGQCDLIADNGAFVVLRAANS